MQNLLIFILAALVLTAGECPIVPGLGGGGGGTEEEHSDVQLDLGGVDGSQWLFDFDDDMSVVVRDGQSIQAATATQLGGTVTVGGAVINVSQFCVRPDILCPQQLLALQTTFTQPAAEDLTQVAFDLTREGPLQFLPTPSILTRLRGNRLELDLTTDASSAISCNLQPGSAAILIFDIKPAGQSADGGLGAGETSPDGGPPEALGDPFVPQRLEGRVATVYSGQCLIVGGSASVPVTSQVEFSVAFTGTRQAAE